MKRSVDGSKVRSKVRDKKKRGGGWREGRNGGGAKLSPKGRKRKVETERKGGQSR